MSGRWGGLAAVSVLVAGAEWLALVAAQHGGVAGAWGLYVVWRAFQAWLLATMVLVTVFTLWRPQRNKIPALLRWVFRASTAAQIVWLAWYGNPVWAFVVVMLACAALFLDVVATEGAP